MRPARDGPATDLVLVGGGHTHIQVLKSFAMRPPPGVRTTVVLDAPIAVYSGMVPGFVAGQYARPELEIDVLPLARLAGARVVLARAVGVDPRARRVEVEGRPPVAYDVVSFDIGSSVAGLDVPGAREHALPTRPIGEFVRAVDARVARATSRRNGPVRAVVVGAGAGGVELAFTLERRLSGAGEARATLLEADDEILPGHRRRLKRRVLEEAGRRDIRVLTGAPVEAVDAEGVTVRDARLPSDLTVWVTGAAPHGILRDSGLTTDADGFVRTRSTLQVEDHDDVFAVGDCASLAADPWVPRAGVYAVRQGPVLTENLRRVLSGRGDLRTYRPQRDFLTLLNLGDGAAIGSKWGIVVAGRPVFRLKDWIDRRFMRRFQALGEDGVAGEFERIAEMRAGMEMLCGGCAAKLGQGALERTLARLEPSTLPDDVELAIEHGDDAAAYRTPDGSRVVSSVDQFKSFTDDPFLVGRIGAVNAASDLLAKGVAPRFAQALVALPEGARPADREEQLYQTLAGARMAFDDMGVTLVGGHTTTASELLVGFQVEGFPGPGDQLLTIDGLEPERALVLTKALGTGVLFHADMLGRVRGPWLEAALASMLASNGPAVALARSFGARAATDVTGFGLAQHLATMLRASSVAARLDLDALPALPGVLTLLAAGLRSTFHEENASAARGIEFEPGTASHERAPLLFDPQTSGGLIFDVEASRAAAAVEALRDAGYSDAAVVGVTRPFAGARLTVGPADGRVEKAAPFAVAQLLR